MSEPSARIEDVSEPSERIDVEDLWIETTAAKLGFERLASELLDRRGAGPYLFVLVVVLVHIPVLSLLGFAHTGTLSVAENPGELFQIPAWIAVVWILLRIKRTYSETVRELPDAMDEDVRDLEIEPAWSARVLTALGVPPDPTGKLDADLERLSPRRLRYGIVLCGWALYATQLALNPEGLIGPVVELTGPVVAGLRFFVVVPFVLYPIGAELLTVVISALVLLPFKIRRAGLVDFSDPRGFAGLIPAGTLFKNVAVSYFILLTLFATFETVAVGTSPTELFSSALIVAGLGVGLVFFFAPMGWTKSYLSAAKTAKLEAIAEASRAVGSTDDLLPYAEPDSPADASQYTFNHVRMQRVEATNEFPVNVGMIYEVLVALVLPYLTSLSVEFLLP